MFCLKHLWLWHPLGLVLKAASEIEYRDNIGVIIGFFDFAYKLHCKDVWTGLYLQI